MDEEKETMVAITIRISSKTKGELDKLGKYLQIDQPAVVLRWIINSFLITVEDKSEPPMMPAILEIARKNHHAKGKQYTKREESD